ncbi:carbonic anhydrase [Pluteus cervinus]|uniref:Carbonic anhydrase n=1 Tax=Pluteus cervinus TaxID=181527 RepID=A0ACD3BDB6_9AGAR|nr:carbonic anhydrase [Pluteus cervinus]
MSTPHSHLNRLLSANAQWANDVRQSEPTFFKDSAKGQAPHTLWIGCADSRVPESVITGSRPGDLFVHRNIANQFHPEDDSVLAVLKYAVDHLGVEHVVIVGHTFCGGAAACLAAAQSGNTTVTLEHLPPTDPLNRWLAPLTQLTSTLGVTSASNDEALALVVDENVKMQVDRLSKTPTITNAWVNKNSKGKDVFIHGWVYDLASGKIRDLEVTRGPGQ